MRRFVPTQLRPRLRAGDAVVLLGSPEYIEGEIITVLTGDRYRARWTTGPGYEGRVTTVTTDEVRKKSPS